MNAIALASIAYGVAAVFALRPLAGHFAFQFMRGKNADEAGYRFRFNPELTEPTGDHWFGAYLLATGLVTLWPVVLVVALVGSVGPTIGAERVAEVEAREKRIRQAEKDLGLETRGGE